MPHTKSLWNINCAVKEPSKSNPNLMAIDVIHEHVNEVSSSALLAPLLSASIKNDRILVNSCWTSSIASRTPVNSDASVATAERILSIKCCTIAESIFAFKLAPSSIAELLGSPSSNHISWNLENRDEGREIDGHALTCCSPHTDLRQKNQVKS